MFLKQSRIPPELSSCPSSCSSPLSLRPPTPCPPPSSGSRPRVGGCRHALPPQPSPQQPKHLLVFSQNHKAQSSGYPPCAQEPIAPPSAKRRLEDARSRLPSSDCLAFAQPQPVVQSARATQLVVLQTHPLAFQVQHLLCSPFLPRRIKLNLSSKL